MPKKPKEHELSAASREVLDELEADLKDVAEEVLGPAGGPDGVEMSGPEFLAYVRRIWPDAKERMALFQQYVPTTPQGQPSRLGLDAWEKLVKDVWPHGYPEPVDPVTATVRAMGIEPTPKGAVPEPHVPPPPQAPVPQSHADVLGQIPPEVIQAYMAGLQTPAPGQAPAGAPPPVDPNAPVGYG